MTRLARALGLGLGLGLALLAGLAAPAFANSWSVDQTSSSVAFEYLKDGAPTEGAFTEFEGQGAFDPADPGAANFNLTIRSASIDLYDRVASAFATSAEWFDSKNHPTVDYVLQGLTLIEGDLYNAVGEITVRGVTKTLQSELTLVIGDTEATASGVLVLNRTDYLLGVGPSAAFVTIGPEVSVRFNLVARRE